MKFISRQNWPVGLEVRRVVTFCRVLTRKGRKRAYSTGNVLYLEFLVVAWVYIKSHWGMHARLYVCYTPRGQWGGWVGGPAIEVCKNVPPRCPKTQNLKPEAVPMESKVLLTKCRKIEREKKNFFWTQSGRKPTYWIKEAQITTKIKIMRKGFIVVPLRVLCKSIVETLIFFTVVHTKLF